MKFLKNLKHIFVVTILSLSLMYGAIFLFDDEFTNSINGFFVYRTGHGIWQDYLHRHALVPSQDIVIIKIDEKSLNELQAKNTLKNLTIPKSTYAILTQKLEEAGAKGIAYDILFQNADSGEKVFADILNQYSNIVIAADYVPDLCIAHYESLYTQLPEGELRDKYPKIVRSSECMTILKNIASDYEKTYGLNRIGYGVLQSSSNINNLSDDEKLSLFCTNTKDGVFDCPGLPRSIYANVRWGMIDFSSAYDRPATTDISNQPYRIWKTGTGGTTNARDMQMETLPLALYTLTQSGTDVTNLPVYSQEMVDSSNDRTFIFDHLLQPYFGSPQASYRQVSFVDVLDMSRVDMIANFSGKYVLIGESGTHINDSKISPVTNTNMDGVEFHAHFLDGLLQNKMLTKLDTRMMMTIIVTLTIFSIFLYFFIPKYLSPIFAIVMMCLILYVSRYTYDIGRTVVDIFLLFLAGGVVTYPVTYMYRFFVVEREKRELQNNFGHYIDPHVVEEIASRGVDIQLGGERRVLSVLFSDIAGFTTISESLDPQELFYLMTSYLSNMTDILISRGGTLDKYIGDAVMGFFGAPLSYEDHAIRAADTAILMRERLPKFNDDLVKHGMKPIDFRVGIATGEVMVGNIGSHDRFNYTVLGDTVNLASRLEGTGKEYDVHIIVPEATRNALGPLYLTRELDTIAVKGKTEGVRIYELVGYAKDYPDRTLYFNYEKALALYRKCDYREAGKLWQTLAQGDPPSRVMMYRCLEILKGNIQVEDGVYQMTHK